MTRIKTTPPIWLLALLATALLTTPTRAQFGGFAGFGWGKQNPDPSGGGGGGGGDDNDGDSTGYSYYGSGFFGSGGRARLIHGILACLAFVILFPLGAILLRIIPGRWSFHAHWAVQMLASVLYIAAFALGVEMVRGIRLPGAGGSFLSNPSTNYHPIIGIIVLILLLIQPLLGIMHHRNFKALQRRTLSSHLHLWDGRVAIILGIVNGGLGLRLADAADTAKLAYTIVAAIFGGTWIVLAVLSECRRGRGRDVLGRKTRESRAMEVRMERIHKKPLPFPRVKASKLQGPTSAPMMMEHDLLPRDQTPHDLRVAQGKMGHGAEGTGGSYVLPPKQYSAADAPLPPGVDLSMRPSENPLNARISSDDEALNSLGHKPGPLISSPRKREPLDRDDLLQFPDVPMRFKQARCGRDEVASIHAWPSSASGMHELPAALPEPGPANDVGPPCESAPHHLESPGRISSESDSDNCEGDGDPFLGTGKPIHLANISMGTTINTNPESPTLARRRHSSMPAGGSGLLNLHDAKNEVFLLLERLWRTQQQLELTEGEFRFQSGRACALGDLQQHILRQSELSHVGTAEAFILRREVVNLDSVIYKAHREASRALERSKRLEHPSLAVGKLQAAVLRLFEEAHAALLTVGKMTGQAASGPVSGTTPYSAVQTAQYPAREDHHLARLTTERRVLKGKVDQLEKEGEQHRRDMARLHRQVDHLQAHRSAPGLPMRNIDESHGS